MGRYAVTSLLLFLSACGGVVNDVPDGSGSGAGGAGGGATTSASTSSTSGSGGTSTTTTGSAGGPACYETNDLFTMTVAMPNGSVFGCAGLEGPGSAEFTGLVVESDVNSWTLDLCPPNAECAPLLSATLSVAAADLHAYLPIGGFVRVTVDVQQPWGCTQRIQVHNASEWGGVTNPVFAGDFLWFAAADGDVQPLDGAPFGVEALPLGCYPDEPPGCAPHEDYELRFFDAQSPGHGVVVPMGQIASFGLANSTEYWAIKNLRSFESGGCDDYGNWGYWITAQMVGED